LTGRCLSVSHSLTAEGWLLLNLIAGMVERADDDSAGSTAALCTAKLCSGQVDTPQEFEEGALRIGLLEIDLGAVDPECHGVIPSCREDLQPLHILVVGRRAGQNRRCHCLRERRVVVLSRASSVLSIDWWRLSIPGPAIGTRG
jgi:hypothetical protein